MRYRRFQPLARDLSVLVLGTAWFGEATRSAAFELLDEWLAVGGNALDSAREYGPARWGESEEVVVAWLRERGVRSQVVLGTKGGHHRVVGVRRVNPEAVREDLEASLATLGGRIDTYLLHRDDPAQPVEPLVDLLNEYRRDGRLGAFGASNWRAERIAEANAYAASAGLEGFAFSSCNLALARQNEPPWPEAVSISDPASRAWYAETQLPLFAWSAQALGWFSGRYSPEVDVVRVYENRENRERRRRAQELADAKGTDANAVALAWVLHQAFPTWALVGPRTVEELRRSVAALDLTLSEEETRWLDLEEE
ncbi:MAG: aldo/keto reductase [Thermoleophilia bacterium]|nr:aldo/keto reductase [Thermoleophilia bacterium]